MARKPTAKPTAKKSPAVKKAPAAKAPAKKPVAKAASKTAAKAASKPAAKAPAKKPAAKAVSKPASRTAAKSKIKAAPAKSKVASSTAAKSKIKAAPAKSKVARKTTAIRVKLNKSQVLDAIAATTDLPKSKVEAVLVELEALMERSLRRRAVGEFQVPGLIKISKYTKKATKKRKGRNLHTNEEIEIPSKRARPALRFKGLKRIRDMIE